MSARRQGVASFTLVALGLSAALFMGACGGKKSSTAPGGSTGTLSGMVTLAGSAGSPVIGAIVTSTSGATTVTNAGGQFTLTLPSAQDVRVDVSKPGYTLNQLHVRLNTNEARTVALGLLAAGNTAAVVVASGGSVTDPASSAKIVLPPGFVTATGPVTVTITGLDPTTDQIQALPGGLQAVDGTGATKYLKPVSFAEYTVKDAAGNVLQFNSAASAGANIELPIPASLVGQPGYANGDPIECYVYDPADGKWKTPVPGVIGASSVNGQPAIKATIFHLSWYGGAPATSDIACVHGTVRDSLGNPLAGVSVEAFQGDRGTTDAAGNYQLSAAAHSKVRVVATRIVGTSFQTSADTVLTGGASDPCTLANLVLHSRRPSYQVMGSVSDILDNTTPTAFVDVQISIGVDGTGDPVSGATVKIGTGGTFVTVPEISPGSGYYALMGGSSGDPAFTLVPGAAYTLQLDYDHDGTVDATGQVRMAGIPVITTPAENSVQKRSFTAAWTDPGTGVSGFVPLYFGINAGLDSLGSFSMFMTSQLSKTIGSGVTDPVVGLPDAPLTAGAYELNLMSLSGPFAGGSGLPSVPTSPNVSGAGTTGYFYSFASATTVDYSSSGSALLATRGVATARPGAQPLSARALATMVDRRLKLRVPMVRVLEHFEQAKHASRFATHVRH